MSRPGWSRAWRAGRVSCSSGGVADLERAGRLHGVGDAVQAPGEGATGARDARAARVRLVDGTLLGHGGPGAGAVRLEDGRVTGEQQADRLVEHGSFSLPICTATDRYTGTVR